MCLCFIQRYEGDRSDGADVPRLMDIHNFFPWCPRLDVFHARFFRQVSPWLLTTCFKSSPSLGLHAWIRWPGHWLAPETPPFVPCPVVKPPRPLTAQSVGYGHSMAFGPALLPLTPTGPWNTPCYSTQPLDGGTFEAAHREGPSGWERGPLATQSHYSLSSPHPSVLLMGYS